MKTPSMSQADRQPCGKECRWLSRHETTKRGQSVRVGTFPGDNDPLVLSALHVDLLPVSGRTSPIGFPLSHVPVPVIFPAIEWWWLLCFDSDLFRSISWSCSLHFHASFIKLWTFAVYCVNNLYISYMIYYTNKKYNNLVQSDTSYSRKIILYLT